MFEGLRKKFSDVVRGFIKKEETKIESEEAKEEHDTIEREAVETEGEKEQAQIQEKKEEERIHTKREGEKKEELIKLSLKTKIKSAFLGSLKLNDSEISGFLDSLRISMLESDVSYETTELFVEDLHSKLKDQEIHSKKIREEITNTIRSSLFSILAIDGGIDVDRFVDQRKKSNELPVKILFLGPNGAGKTTTIAKIAYHFKSKGISNVLSASDTFRAAAIEQIEHHAKRIGVPVIKSGYGADPASIAFDAIAYAAAHKIDIVLIDSAGRQETNKSLINEIQKMVRVSKPDITIFVGESTAGNQIAEQIKEFNKFVKINGIILTKLDCDAKGGGAISIAHTTGIPILFLGVGEKYDALLPYDPNIIVNAILPENA